MKPMSIRSSFFFFPFSKAKIFLIDRFFLSSKLERKKKHAGKKEGKEADNKDLGGACCAEM